MNKDHITISAHRFFLCVAPIMCFLMVWLTPPCQVADEYAHYFRSYQISEGQWYGIKFDRRVGGFIPVSLLNTADAFVNMPFQPHQKVNLDNWRQTWSIQLCPEQRVAKDFANSGFMPPFAYLPQAAGMRLGTLFNSPPILLLYLGRLVNAAVWCLVVYLALRCTPTASWLLTALALAPMSIFQAASLSYDATINSFSFLVLALILRRAVTTAYCLNWKDLLIWMFLIVTIVVSKPFYAALALLVFIVPPAPSAKRGHYIKMGLFLVIVTVIYFSLWIIAQKNFLTYDEYNPAFREGQALMAGINPSLHAHYLLNHPGVFLRAGMATLFAAYPIVTWIGNLGWIDTPFPVWFYVGFGLLLLLLLATDRAPNIRIALWQRVVLVGIAVLAIVLLLVSLYLIWTPVGISYIRGLHGRYLIPIMPLVLIALHGKLARMPAAWCNGIVPIILIMVQAMTIAVVFCRYY